MSNRRAQGVLLLFLSVGLSLFLTLHAIAVDVDFELCFGNIVDFLHRPSPRVSEMSFGALAFAMEQHFSTEDLIMAVPGLLPLIPFAMAWCTSKDSLGRMLWVISALVAFAVIIAVTLASDLEAFYDCDRNGVSVGILIAPILYTVIDLIAVFVLAALRFFWP